MQTNTHSIDISALGRDKRSLNLAKEPVAIEVPDLSLYYGQKQALFNVSMNIPRQRVTAFIGPSGCGKSTLLRCFNRMNDLVDGCRIEGAINLDGTNIYRKGEDVADLRRRVGMVFQKPNPFPKSIYENVVYGLRIQGIKQKRVLDETVEWALKGAALWDEVKDRLHESALGLSGGQQQRVACARALVSRPEIIFGDEPTGNLDSNSSAEVLDILRTAVDQDNQTVVIVTHDAKAASYADRVVFLADGKLVNELQDPTMEAIHNVMAEIEG